ncbi:MAG: hypothetical protein CVU18_11350 [Betaproteobacteria bacterium HGW-Betaproteobacteria-12]|nr:MAG: hypothetical protein CVU18_11350 [Betaproteobacteria bacterium HGW-Betaproteobacteria-12]
MGQAKKRGTLEQRRQAAKARIDALRPEVIICNQCGGEIQDILDLPTSGMPGIDAAFAGHCQACSSSTYAIKGDPKAVEQLMLAITETTGDVPLLGVQ